MTNDTQARAAPFKGPFRVATFYGHKTFYLVQDADKRNVSCDFWDRDEAQWLCDRLNSPTPAAQPSMAEGWVLVPREPTDEHIAAFFNGWAKLVLPDPGKTSYPQSRPWMNGWHAFLSAAPTAPMPLGLTSEEQEYIKRTRFFVEKRDVGDNAWITMSRLLSIIDRLAPQPTTDRKGSGLIRPTLDIEALVERGARAIPEDFDSLEADDQQYHRDAARAVIKALFQEKQS